MSDTRRRSAQPFVDVRIGGFRMTLKQRPARLAAALTALVLCSASSWAASGGWWPIGG
ncbi:hypothetical protein [Streptomyces sp. bgisy034]|uniref:hypothetical protein n=1 Tax=Streptomyces sp. bgisy034 TaxID=3413774 RepID=UPI003EB94108